MKDIKERVRDKNPKIRNPAARFRKNWFASGSGSKRKAKGTT